MSVEKESMEATAPSNHSQNSSYCVPPTYGYYQPNNDNSNGLPKYPNLPAPQNALSGSQQSQQPPVFVYPPIAFPPHVTYAPAKIIIPSSAYGKMTKIYFFISERPARTGCCATFVKAIFVIVLVFALSLLLETVFVYIWENMYYIAKMEAKKEASIPQTFNHQQTNWPRNNFN